MSSEQERRELDEMARRGETVVPGGAGGKSLETQEHLAEGRRGGQTRKEQLGRQGYHEMGRKGRLSTVDDSGGERAANGGIQIDESKFRTRSSLAPPESAPQMGEFRSMSPSSGPEAS